MSLPPLPESIYRLQCGTLNAPARDRKADNPDKLWAMLVKYQGREGITEILVTRYEPTVVETPNANGEVAVSIGSPTAMLALHRESEESPWTDLLSHR